jgi:uncharacterized protein YgiM (DUF1202 family)
MAFSLVRYSQRDPQWKDDKLGNSSLTLGTSGCAVAAVAMLLSGYGCNETPGSLNSWLKSHGGFIGAAIVWGAITARYPKIKFANIILCRDSDAPLAAIDASIAAGQPVLVEVDSSPAAGLQTHWVVLYAKQGADYLMLDPWPFPSDTGETLLTPRYSQGKSLKRTITAAVWYQAQGNRTPVSPPPSKTPSMVGASMAVRVLDGLDLGLRLRTEPTTTSMTVELEASGTLLAVLEPLNVADPKVGQYDQWLRVRDPQGREGYVAAWYVERAEIVQTPPVPPETPPSTGSAPGDSAQPAPQETPLLVFVSQIVGDSGLRLRAEPNTSGALIKVLAAGRELTVLDPPEEAKPAIGRQDTWIKVRDPENATGYVAAWLVTLKASGSRKAPSPAPEPGPASAPAAALIVSVLSSIGSSGLRMRSQPSLAGSLVTIVPAGHQLSVLEPEAGARPKIGVTGQWLSVKDSTGKTGYVAAWFVQEVKPAVMAPSAGESLTAGAMAGATPEPALTVHVASLPAGTPGLYLRETPASDGKVIRLLPASLPLQVLEDREAAQQKIGVFNAWLHVLDPQGREGYVAAWFVTQ